MFIRNVANAAVTSVIHPPSSHWHLNDNRDRIAVVDVPMIILAWGSLLTVAIMLLVLLAIGLSWGLRVLAAPEAGIASESHESAALVRCG